MSVRKIIQLKRSEFLDGKNSLRQTSHPVEEFNDELRSKIRDLVDTFESHQIAVGLAAPQIGIQLRMSVVNAQKGKLPPHLILVNPKIITHSHEAEEKFESCMSLPLCKGMVNRFVQIEVSFQDEHGKQKTIKAEKFLARVIQHEIDHLDGILYVDRMTNPAALEPSDIPKIIE